MVGGAVGGAPKSRSSRLGGAPADEFVGTTLLLVAAAGSEMSVAASASLRPVKSYSLEVGSLGSSIHERTFCACTARACSTACAPAAAPAAPCAAPSASFLFSSSDENLDVAVVGGRGAAVVGGGPEADDELDEDADAAPPSSAFTGTTSPRCAAWNDARMSADENFFTSFL